jgi:hypothetical protein
VLILSPTERQSAELLRDKLLPLWGALGRPLHAEPAKALSLVLANGSRVVALPGNEEGIRCFSAVSLLVLDEAARVPDELYRAVRPMLAVSNGALIALSTPFGKRGWFYEAWTEPRPWKRVRVSAGQCPRITPEFLAEERAALGERWFAQEYLVEFVDLVGALFSGEDIAAACACDAAPLFPGG